MTDEERDELNIFIAEHLFGWGWVGLDYANRNYFVSPERLATYKPDYHQKIPKLKDATPEIPNYCTDPTALQLVKDKLVEMCNANTIRTFHTGYGYDWFCSIEAIERGFYIEGETEGEALCLAVKKMLEG